MEFVSFKIRLLPRNNEFELELPTSTISGKIVEIIQNKGLAPIYDQFENPISYNLVKLGSNSPMEENQTLKEYGITDGEIILMIPRIIAG